MNCKTINYVKGSINWMKACFLRTSSTVAPLTGRNERSTSMLHDEHVQYCRKKEINKKNLKRM